MAKYLFILSTVPGSEYYAQKGYKKPVTVYVHESTYKWLMDQAAANEWSLQTITRRCLEAAERGQISFLPPTKSPTKPQR